jgi:hypothetical protein
MPRLAKLTVSNKQQRVNNWFNDTEKKNASSGCISGGMRDVPFLRWAGTRLSALECHDWRRCRISSEHER